MKLGARILKTGVAITIALYIAMWLGLNPPTYAAIAATFAVQPSIYKSVETIFNHIQANVISAILAITFVLLFGQEPFVVGVVVILVIGINLRLNKEDIIPLAVVTSIIIMMSPSDAFLAFALERFSLIMIGVLSSFGVNMLFLPPKHETQLYNKIVNANDYIVQWIRLLTRHEADYQTLNQDISKLNESIVKMDNLFLLYRDERNYVKKNAYSKMRKVVLFRQMIRTSKKAMDILETLSKHENSLQQLPDSLQDLLQQQLDDLTNFHDRILLKYAGKVRQESEELYEDVNEDKQQLADVFLNYYDDQMATRSEWVHVFPVIALIIEYNEELEHLDRLVGGFFTYHTTENEVELEDDRMD
ncbi:FUSC family protein [Texcoconibacillus texcoconensis]|uniref:Uncharacterized membrane protein YgaE (UPF0421/DUF939 family) n=1 Tax=Texcoconibacillus texcoconensis TaxID=1095777 RepID=A0A840QUZ6_9BACI|nr:aromatic acid exporter family protein [Texcoconibacillus texcoconensis]MBB5175067.1 uncharacterized membrane protein YgaE (UPF0421/DUF939 family) [Texcoconibacillus texcoconensis]